MASEPPSRTQTPTAGTRHDADPVLSSASDGMGISARVVAVVSEALSWRQYPLDFWLCTLQLFLGALGGAILGAPSPKLLETAVCRQYLRRDGWFHDDDPPDEFCKRYEVQVQLAVVLTVLSTLSTLAATIMQIPMGMVVDQKGRRLALCLNITSNILYWGSVAIIGSVRGCPVWCFYLTPLFLLIGGGPWATGTLLFAAINERLRPEQRTIAFSMMEAVSGIADLVGPVLGALTMVTHLWIPFLIATAIFFLMFIPALYLSDDVERDVVAQDDATSVAETEPLLGNSTTSDRETNHRAPTPGQLFRSGSAILLIPLGASFLSQIARDSINYLIPWVALRFNETMARAGLLFSLRAIVSLLLYFVLLPLATSFLTVIWKGSSATRDLALSALGVFFSAAGTLATAFAPNTAIFATGFAVAVLGSGMSVTLRAFLAANVDPMFSGRLFALISTTGTVGSVVGMPVMGAAYSLGVKNGILVVGLPFLVSAVSYLLILGLLIFLLIKQ